MYYWSTLLKVCEKYLKPTSISFNFHCGTQTTQPCALNCRKVLQIHLLQDSSFLHLNWRTSRNFRFIPATMSRMGLTLSCWGLRLINSQQSYLIRLHIKPLPGVSLANNGLPFLYVSPSNASTSNTDWLFCKHLAYNHFSLPVYAGSEVVYCLT